MPTLAVLVPEQRALMMSWRRWNAPGDVVMISLEVFSLDGINLDAGALAVGGADFDVVDLLALPATDEGTAALLERFEGVLGVHLMQEVLSIHEHFVSVLDQLRWGGLIDVGNLLLFR